MSYLATKPTAEENRRAKIAHAGTFNANPLSAAAGVAMLVLGGRRPGDPLSPTSRRPSCATA